MRDLDDKGSNMSLNAGVNLVYPLMKNLNLDFKMSNQLETRINLWSSLGLEYNF